MFCESPWPFQSNLLNPPFHTVPPLHPHWWSRRPHWWSAGSNQHSHSYDFPMISCDFPHTWNVWTPPERLFLIGFVGVAKRGFTLPKNLKMRFSSFLEVQKCLTPILDLQNPPSCTGYPQNILMIFLGYFRTAIFKRTVSRITIKSLVH